MRPDVRRRVEAAVAATGYRPNRAARQLRSSRSTTIGLIIADIQSPFFTAICRSVEAAASDAGLSVLFCNSDEKPEREAAHVRLLRDENVAGLILAPASPTLRRLELGTNGNGSTPIVVIDRKPLRDTADCVIIDNVKAAADLTGHLLDDGRRQIAGIFGTRNPTGRLRRRGFTQAHEARGLTVDTRRVRAVPPREADGYAATRALLADASLGIDAIVAGNGLVAAGAFRAIGEAKLRDRVALTSFDETPWTPLVEPGVSVVEQPTEAIGRKAVAMLLARIKGDDRPPYCEILPHQLIIRPARKV